MKKISESYEKLLEFIYDKYEKQDIVRTGQFASVLLNEFEEQSGIEMGSEPGRLDCFRFLYEKGWIILSPKQLVSYARVRLTTKGIEHVEQRRNMGKKILKASGNVAEIIGRGLKGFSGR